MPPRAVLDASVLVPRWSRGALRNLALLDPPPCRLVWSTAIVGEIWRALTTQRLRRGDPPRTIAAQSHAMWQWLDPVMEVVPAAAPLLGAPPSPMRDPRDEHLWSAAFNAEARMSSATIRATFRLRRHTRSVGNAYSGILPTVSSS